MKATALAPILVTLGICTACGGSSEPPNAPEAMPAQEQSTVDAEPAPESPESESEPAVSEEPAAEDEDASPSETAAEPDDAEEPTAIKRDPGVETRTTIVIQKIIRDHRHLVRSCYEKALKTHKGLQGDLTIKLVIDAKGNVQTAELNRERSTLTQPDLVQCAIAALRGIRFPESSRGFETKVNYPFNLKP